MDGRDPSTSGREASACAPAASGGADAPDLAELLDYRFGAPVRVPEDLALETNADAPAGLRQIADHRSHRRFADRDVSDALLDTLLACALSAPAKSDLQQAGVLKVEDRGKREAVAALIPSMPWIATAPRFLIFLGDGRRIRRVCELKDKPFANDHLDAFMNASVDAALVLMNFVRAVEAAGLGCCPVSVVRNHAREMAQIFELPSWVFPVAGMAVGYPAGEGRMSPRLPLSLTVHEDRYDDSRLAEELDRYDRYRNSRQPLAPEKQRYIDRYGVDEDYGWSEDKARQVSLPEREDFGRFIREQGFKLD